jgi:basic membrane protein A and related proteins
MSRSITTASFHTGRARHTRDGIAASGALLAVALLIAGCNPFSNPPGPTPPPSGSGPTVAATRTAVAPTPSPSPQVVATITLVSAIAEPKDASPSGLTWKGVQAAGTKIGVAATLVEPVSRLDLSSAVEKAATGRLAVVVTIGPDADGAVRAAAAAHPATQFLEVGVAVPATSPGNVHGIVFDEAQAGYLAGFVAGSFSGGGKVGFVGDTATDSSSANYAAGFESGASQASAGTIASVAFVGTPDSPDAGRTTAAALVKSGVNVLTALPDLSGIGSVREACARQARLVAVETDAWQVIPDVRSCLIVSVLARYDVAVEDSILTVASGKPLAAITIEDVSTGGIALSDFHAEQPAGFDTLLAGVLAALEKGPPHPTPAPPTGSLPPGGSPSPSPK